MTYRTKSRLWRQTVRIYILNLVIDSNFNYFNLEPVQAEKGQRAESDSDLE